MVNELLRTKRLCLRKMTEADAPRLFNIWSNPDVTKFMNIETFSSEEQAKEMIHFLHELAAQNKAIRYTIIENSTNQIIGSCGFNTLDFENSKAEIGYELDRPFWGNGYGREAISCLINEAFNHLNLMRIEAEVEPENLNSIKLLKKSGFIFEGTLRKSEKSKGEFVDLNMYSLLKTD